METVVDNRETLHYDGQPWQTEFWGCFSDPVVCCIGLVLPNCHYGVVMGEVEGEPPWQHGWISKYIPRVRIPRS
jgi:hypothetical protein